jgi:membrane protein insertase Oxa1/YidC/SpoIIIJ
MTPVWALSSFIAGLAMGWLAGAIFTTAQTTLWQKKMQRKLHYWQSETAYARARARHLASLLTAVITLLPPEIQDWQPGDTNNPES